MPMPVGARGRTTARPGPRNTPPRVTRSIIRRAQAENPPWTYIPRSSFQQSSGGYRSGGGGGGGGYGGGGGGGGGPSAYEKFLIEEEKRKQRELAQRKAALTKQLQGARGKAIPLLGNYYKQYGKDIGQVFKDNRALNAGYSKQLSDVGAQMRNQYSGVGAGLQRDLQGQGMGSQGSPELAAILAAVNQGNAGTSFLQNAGGMYNTQLAQAMGGAQRDASSMGAAIKASSLGNLENAYASLLGQIGLIGLTG
jgi:hypothetical protein